MMIEKKKIKSSVDASFHLLKPCSFGCLSVTQPSERRACTRGSILDGRSPLSRVKLKKNTRNNTVSQDRRKKIETFRGILLKESRGRENSNVFEHKAYSSTGILLICYSVLSFGNTKLYSFITP